MVPANICVQLLLQSNEACLRLLGERDVSKNGAHHMRTDRANLEMESKKKQKNNLENQQKVFTSGWTMRR